MRYLSILLVVLAAVGISGAAWYPQSANLTTTGDVNADNGVFTGDLSVTGIGSFTGGTVNSGVYDGDFRLAANHSFYSTTGSGAIDWGNATGIFKPPVGTNTFGGIADFNAAMTARGITQDSGYSLAQSGAAGITVGTIGITASASPLKLLEDVTIAANKSLTGLSGSGAVDFSAMTGGYSSPLGTNTFNGNILGAGLTTTTTGGGAVVLKGNTTVYTDKALAVTTQDKLTVAGVVVRPGIMKRTLAAGTAAATNVTVSGMAAGDELISVVSYTTAASIASMADRTSEYAVAAGHLYKAAGTNSTGNQLDIMWMDKT